MRQFFCLILLAAVIIHFENVWAAFPDQDLERGQELSQLKCTKCHKLYEPSGYSDEEWDRWMGKMRKKAHLNDEDYRLITGYSDSLRKK